MPSELPLPSASPVPALPTLGHHCLETGLSPLLDCELCEGRFWAVLVTAMSPALSSTGWAQRRHSVNT